MISFILGKPKSGKSAWAEDVAAAGGGVLTYVGTLPRALEYASTIRDHRLRRGERWRTEELNGQVSSDLGTLRNLIESRGTILVDGLSFYLLHYCFTLASLRSLAIKNQAYQLLQQAGYSASRVIIVDSTIAPGLTFAQKGLLGQMHRSISSCAKERWLFYGGQAYSAADEEMIMYSLGTIASAIVHDGRKVEIK